MFVSHSHQDDDYRRAFVHELRAAGVDVWYDEHNLTSGQLLTDMQRELHARHIFVPILSKAALHESTWVKNECMWAFTLYSREPGRTFLPVTGAPIEQSDFGADWLFLEGFKRIEAPKLLPYPPQEAARRMLNAIGHVVPEPDRFPKRLAELGFISARSDHGVEYILPPLYAVPAGPFLMGSDPRRDPQAFADEQPQHSVMLPAYQIARFPSRWPSMPASCAPATPSQRLANATGHARPFGRLRLVARRHRLRRLARPADWPALAPADRSRVGEGGTRHRGAHLSVGRHL